MSRQLDVGAAERRGLIEERDKLAALALDLIADVDAFDKGGAFKKLRSYCDLKKMAERYRKQPLSSALLGTGGEFVERKGAKALMEAEEPHALVYNGSPICWCGEDHMPEPIHQEATFAERLRLAAKHVYYDRDNDEAWDELAAALDATDPRSDWIRREGTLRAEGSLWATWCSESSRPMTHRETQLEERLLGARIIEIKPHANYEGGIVIEFEHRGTDDNSGWLLVHQDNVHFGDDLA